MDVHIKCTFLSAKYRNDWHLRQLKSTSTEIEISHTGTQWNYACLMGENMCRRPFEALRNRLVACASRHNLLTDNCVDS